MFSMTELALVEPARISQTTLRERETMAVEWNKQLRAYYCAEGWSRLDFVDLGLVLCLRLTDDDLGAILMCIDAQRNLKQLTLTNCFLITGQGLQPLRGSGVLEKLDLGLCHRFIDLMHTRGSCLSAPTVLDILESILEAGRGFQRLQLPRDWLTISKSSGAEKGSCSSVIQAFNCFFVY